MIIQNVTDTAGRELLHKEIEEVFHKEYLQIRAPFELKEFNVVKRHIASDEALSSAEIDATVLVNGKEKHLQADGNGPLDAFCTAMKKAVTGPFTLCSYHEHALNKGSSATAVTYIEIESQDGKKLWGAGIDTDIIVASIKAVLSCLNRIASS